MFVVFGVAIAMCLLQDFQADALRSYLAGATGSDVSWPNCAADPPKTSAFGIVGVTGGLVFAPNQCLFDEAHWFNHLSLYVNTGYVGKSRAKKYAGSPKRCVRDDEACIAYDYGYNAGVYAVYYAASQFVTNDMWWLDVETENSWSENPMLNRASLQGTVEAIRHESLFSNVGYYSYPGQWDIITGKWQNGYPAWAATGSELRHDALDACKASSFNGGELLLTQYTTQLDEDFVCSR